jgi:hypothetical protein
VGGDLRMNGGSPQPGSRGEKLSVQGTTLIRTGVR